MSHVALFLLGSPRIERDGVPVPVERRKSLALVSYLALAGPGLGGGRQSRDTLATLLWPEQDQIRARAGLRAALATLKKALGEGVLEADRESVGLKPDAKLWLDVAEFRDRLAECQTHGHPPEEACPACLPLLAQAAALYRDDLLAGFTLRDSPAFDEWQFFQTEGLRQALAGALARLAQAHTNQGEFEAAVPPARRRIALDPLHEPAHRQLMRLYAWSGQRTAAARQYGECVRLLQDELGVPPQEATTQLYEAIKAGRHPLPPAGPGIAPPEERRQGGTPSALDRLRDLPAQPPPFLEKEEPAERPVFVAREHELAQLDRFLDAALSGQGTVAFVTGGAGRGKTALLQEFARRAQEARPDLVIAWGHGNAHTGIGDPYLPFREVLGLLAGDVEARWAAGAMTGEQARRLWHLLPLTVQALVEAGPDLIDLFVPGGPLVRRARAFPQWPIAPVWLTQLEQLVARQTAASDKPNLQQSALFEQFTQVLRALAGQKPLLLALDDLQWADGGSLSLLFHLGRRIEGSRLLIVGAYRPAEVALGRPSTFRRAQDRSSIEPRDRHPLEPVVNEFKRYFGDIEVDLGQAEDRQFVAAFLDSEPNRLDDTFRQMLFRQTRGHPLFTIELLQGMQKRGDLVPDGEGRWVEGPALDWETLPARVEAVIAERIGRLPERLRAALAVASVEGETFTAEVMARVGETSEQETVRHLSDTLDRRYRLVRAQEVLQVGGRHLSRYRFRHILFQKHLYNSLDPVQRVHLHQAVGTTLETLYGGGVEEAAATEASAAQLARHFQQAGITEKAVGYLRQAGERAQRLYANEEAAEHFHRALALLEDTLGDESRESWRLGMAARLYEGLGDVREWTGEHDGAQAAYGEAVAHVPRADRIWQARLHRKMGNIWRLQGRYDRASGAYALAETALGPESPESSPAWRQEWVQIQLERMWLHYWLGQWRDISDLADQIHLVVEQHGTRRQCISFFLSLASMYNRRDRYAVSEETLALCQTALAISQESEDLGEIAWARFMLGFGQLWYGNLDGAEKQMQTALALAERTGDVVHQSRCLTYLTVLFRKRSHVDRARHFVSRSLAAATASQMVEYIGMAQANLAWIAWREGDLAGAKAKGQAALELWHQLPAGHSSCAFRWAALWPLIGVALAQHQISAATEYARALLEPEQQRLPDALTVAVESAISAWESDESETTSTYLGQATEAARELGYL